ncbi:MAG TPA: type II secretion system minor pseudopilin GspK [Aquabacterium sp.]|nr:type II secretion system minor pseudopilin GspK [Aquabacterium sp.]
MTVTYRAKRAAAQQRGAALLMAMIIVTLVATFSASMVWQQWRAVQIEAAERVQAQSSWVLVGALDWARLILKEDKRNGGPDHLGEPWAIPLAEARLSSFLATDQDNSDDAPEAFLSGKVEDMTSRYNLRNILSDQGDVVPEELAVLKRLCELAGVPSTLANTLADSYRKATLAAQGDDPDTLAKLGGSASRAMAPLLPQTMDQLTWLGLDAGTVERLKPYLTLLPERTQVNINTASKEVIASVIDGLDLARAARIVQARQRNAFKTVDEVQTLLAMPSLNLTRVSISSDFFEVRGRLRYEDNIIEQRHMVQRTGDDVVVRSRARFAGVDKPYEGSPPP